MLADGLTDLCPAHLVVGVHLTDDTAPEFLDVGGELREAMEHLGESFGLFGARRFGERCGYLGGRILHDLTVVGTQSDGSSPEALSL